MTTGLIVLSRFDSRRLPGKALRPIAGRPMLGRVLDRVRLARRIDQVVVATSDREVDDTIDAFASAEGVAVFRGSAEDVLGRCLDCAEAFSFDRIVRISGDSPFMDPIVIDRLVTAQADGGEEIVTNVLHRSFPPGVSVEVLSLEALRRLAALATGDQDREHVTTYVYRHPDKFLIRNVAAAASPYQGAGLVVDDESDLARADWITRQVQGRSEVASLDTIVTLAQAWEKNRQRTSNLA